jgi:hypothetical protein
LVKSSLWKRYSHHHYLVNRYGLSVSLTVVPRENHRPVASHWQKLCHTMLFRIHLSMCEIRTHNVSLIGDRGRKNLRKRETFHWHLRSWYFATVIKFVVMPIAMILYIRCAIIKKSSRIWMITPSGICLLPIHYNAVLKRSNIWQAEEQPIAKHLS